MVPTKAACCIILSKDSKRNLDVQAGATAKDLKTMANYVVMNPMELLYCNIKRVNSDLSEIFLAGALHMKQNYFKREGVCKFFLKTPGK